jgi:hypothetical protein
MPDTKLDLDDPQAVFIAWAKPERPDPLDFNTPDEFTSANADYSHDMVEWIGENENERDRLQMSAYRDREERMIVANIDAMNHFNDVAARKPDEDLAWRGDGSLAIKRREWIHDLNDALVALRFANDEEVRLAP